MRTPDADFIIELSIVKSMVLSYCHGTLANMLTFMQGNKGENFKFSGEMATPSSPASSNLKKKSNMMGMMGWKFIHYSFGPRAG